MIDGSGCVMKANYYLQQEDGVDQSSKQCVPSRVGTNFRFATIAFAG
jgi:hypothetical protein